MLNLLFGEFHNYKKASCSQSPSGSQLESVNISLKESLRLIMHYRDLSFRLENIALPGYDILLKWYIGDL
jgi:hypothetical protein